MVLETQRLAHPAAMVAGSVLYSMHDLGNHVICHMAEWGSGEQMNELGS
jgi:hypothetical protein